MPRHCPRCGANLAKGASKCSACGIPIFALRPDDPEGELWSPSAARYAEHSAEPASKRSDRAALVSVIGGAALLAGVAMLSTPPKRQDPEPAVKAEPAAKPVPPPPAAKPSLPPPAAMAPAAEPSAGAMQAPAAPAASIGPRWWVFRGVLHDALSLKPVVKARLYFLDFSTGRGEQTVSRDDGRFSIKLPAPQSEGYQLKIMHPDYLARYLIDPKPSPLALSQEARRSLAEQEARTIPPRIPIGAVDGELEMSLWLIPRDTE